MMCGEKNLLAQEKGETGAILMDIWVDALRERFMDQELFFYFYIYFQIIFLSVFHLIYLK
jgi:hypothetical protein